MASNCDDLTLSIFLYLAVGSPIWTYMVIIVSLKMHITVMRTCEDIWVRSVTVMKLHWIERTDTVNSLHSQLMTGKFRKSDSDNRSVLHADSLSSKYKPDTNPNNNPTTRHSGHQCMCTGDELTVWWFDWHQARQCGTMGNWTIHRQPTCVQWSCGLVNTRTSQLTETFDLKFAVNYTY